MATAGSPPAHQLSGVARCSDRTELHHERRSPLGRLTLEDFHATEKIAYLLRKLSTSGAPAGTDPSPGDLAYYAPRGNLAIFYRDAPYAHGLIRLGRIDSGADALKVAGSLKLTIETQR